MNKTVKIESIISNQFQPNICFLDEKIEELVFKINNGYKYQIVAKEADGLYEVIIGEKVLKALKRANVQNANIIISDLKDTKEILSFNLSELNTIEQAIFFLSVMKESGCTQEELADLLSKSQSTIANKIRILNLPQEIQDALTASIISERHARGLLALDGDRQIKAFNEIVDKKLNVRDSEELINNIIKRRKQSKRYLTKGFTRNIQIALNSINQCLDMVKQLGIDVIQDIDENDEEVVIKLTLPK